MSRLCSQDWFVRVRRMASARDYAMPASRTPQQPLAMRWHSHCAVPAADYKWSLRGLEGGALEAELRRCHLRSADRMVKVAGRNGGVYIKAGQHLGQMVGALEGCCCSWPVSGP